MKHGYHKGGTGKGGRMDGTRVTETQGETPISGAPQKKELNVKGTRVKLGPGMSRKNDPPKKAHERMGLKIGTRVTSSKAKTG